MIDLKEKILIDPFNEENWNFIIPDGTFLTWLKNNYFQREYWEFINMVNCRGQELKTIDGLENLINLCEAHFYENEIEKLDLENEKICTLNINNNKIDEIIRIKTPNLANLLCSYNKISNLDNIDAPLLLNLEIVKNNIKSLDSFKNFKNLSFLEISRNELTSLEGVEEMNNLTTLCCGKNKLKSLGGIKKLEKLNYLDICNNEISDLENLPENLETLYCNNNKIKKISFENLKNIRTISIHNNQIEELDGIENLEKLRNLYCSENNFTPEYKEYLIKYCKEKQINLCIADFILESPKVVEEVITEA